MKLDRNQQLVDHLIRSYRLGGIAIVSGRGSARIELVTDVGLVVQSGIQMICCADAATAAVILAAAAASLPKRPKPSEDAIVAALEAAADAAGVALTTHDDVVERARAVVATIETKLDTMQAMGHMSDINQRFKIARAAGTFSSYNEFLQAWKKQMLETFVASRRSA